MRGACICHPGPGRSARLPPTLAPLTWERGAVLSGPTAASSRPPGLQEPVSVMLPDLFTLMILSRLEEGAAAAEQRGSQGDAKSRRPWGVSVSATQASATEMDFQGSPNLRPQSSLTDAYSSIFSGALLESGFKSHVNMSLFSTCLMRVSLLDGVESRGWRQGKEGAQ